MLFPDPLDNLLEHRSELSYKFLMFPCGYVKVQNAERYIFMVEEVIALVAKCAVNNSKVSSDVGIVGLSQKF